MVSGSCSNGRPIAPISMVPKTFERHLRQGMTFRSGAQSMTFASLLLLKTRLESKSNPSFSIDDALQATPRP